MNGSRRLPGWDQLAAEIPDMVTPMRRYLDQLACILRPGSVSGADLALRSLAGFLVEQAPQVRFIADIRRRHIEDFRTWLTARTGYRIGRLTLATLAHRLGTLRMFFVRISDWDWPEAPSRVPIIPADLPRQDHPLPKALDDPSAAQLLRAAQAEPRMLTRVVVEVLLRTGLRVGEFTALATRRDRAQPHTGLCAATDQAREAHRSGHGLPGSSKAESSRNTARRSDCPDDAGGWVSKDDIGNPTRTTVSDRTSRWHW